VWDPPGRLGPVRMTYDLTGSQSMTLKLDEATGWFTGGEISNRLEGEAVMSAEGEETSVPTRVMTWTEHEPT